ncbi:MAG TPA: hypothetical protein VFA80_19930 [Xanthobacteraceae bacterium]|nr:hypothetical protein [Xanthobacteraceae bacterium]
MSDDLQGLPQQVHVMRRPDPPSNWADILGWICWLAGLAAFAGVFGNSPYNAAIWVGLAASLQFAGGRLPELWRISGWGILAVGGLAFILHAAGVLPD